jgi:hypothetical protein
MSGNAIDELSFVGRRLTGVIEPGKLGHFTSFQPMGVPIDYSRARPRKAGEPQTSRQQNLAAAARTCAELALDAKGPLNEFDAEELALAVKLRDLPRLEVIAGELMDE